MVPFTAQTRMSGMDFPAADGDRARQVRKGAAETVERMVEAEGGTVPLEVLPMVEQISTRRRHAARRLRPPRR